MRKFEDIVTNEKFFVEKIDNGLTVIVMPKKDFYKTYAIFSTKYGSQDLEFISLKEDNYIKTPEGIAHFLEHKLFEREDGSDVANIFANFGADVNAYTTSTNTAYLFSTVENVYENLKTLIDFVQTPYFSDAAIEKERGIIEQELLMYLDNPQNVLYFATLKGLYKENTVRNEIGGTIESIKEIDKELLYKCHETFYHPSNMVLVVVGNVKEDEVIDFVKENQQEKIFLPKNNTSSKYYLESSEINQKETILEMDVNIPKVSFGIKFPLDHKTKYELLKIQTAIEILVQIYFDDSSIYYEDMMEKEILNNSFSFDTYSEETYCHSIFSLDSTKPMDFVNKMEEMISLINKKEIVEKEFIRFKRYYQTLNLKRFDNIEYIAGLMVDLEHMGLNYFDLMKVVDELTIEDIEAVKKYFKLSSTAYVIINPKNNG